MNRVGNFSRMLELIMVPEPQYAVAKPLQYRRTRFIMATRCRVLPTIDFDDQLGLGTNKIGDIAGNRYLSTKAEAFEVTTT